VHAEEALENQRLLMDRLDSPQYAQYMEAFQEDVARKGAGPVYQPIGDHHPGVVFTKSEKTRLAMARPYFVAKAMMPLITWAADGLDGTDRFARDLWPDDFGFLFFEEPIVSTEMWGRTVTTKAISWGRQNANFRLAKGGEIEIPLASENGTMLVFYTDMDDPRDEVNAQIKADAVEAGDWGKYQAMGRLHVHHFTFLPDDIRVGPPTTAVPEWYAQYAEGKIEPEDLTKAAPNDARFILSLLMLLNQTVVSVAEEEVSRPLARRARRMKLPPRVTVIKLRRLDLTNREHVGATSVEWQHQWIVGHFWRWQPRGPRSTPGVAPHTHVSPTRPDTTYTVDLTERGTRMLGCDVPGCEGYTVRIYIHDFWKGPADAPIMQSEKIMALIR
jgi:hypothetical protein